MTSFVLKTHFTINHSKKWSLFVTIEKFLKPIEFLILVTSFPLIFFSHCMWQILDNKNIDEPILFDQNCRESLIKRFRLFFCCFFCFLLARKSIAAAVLRRKFAAKAFQHFLRETVRSLFDKNEVTGYKNALFSVAKLSIPNSIGIQVRADYYNFKWISPFNFSSVMNEKFSHSPEQFVRIAFIRRTSAFVERLDNKMKHKV